MQQPAGSAFSELENLYHAQNSGLGLHTQQTTVISCPKKMVGRVIGKNGETIKALQQFTGAQIQIDQRCDPTRVSIAGPPKSLQIATSMVQDIVAGTFKGFAMLRSFANQASKVPEPVGFLAQPVPVYIEGYGFVPPSQFYDPSETAAPVFQQNLHGFNQDPVSVLRAISPSNTSGSGGPTASPQGLPATNQSNLSALSAALVHAQLFGLRSNSPLPETAGQNFQSPPFLQAPGAHQLPQFMKPPIGAPGRQVQMQAVARSLFAGSEAQQQQQLHQHHQQLHQHHQQLQQHHLQQEQPNLQDVLPASSVPMPSTSLPSLSSGHSSLNPQAPSLTVWSQLEKLSPDGGAASGSPLLTPINTPSRTSSPAQKSQQSNGTGTGTASSSVEVSAALLAQLQALSMASTHTAPASEPQQPSLDTYYSNGWPATATEPSPLLPQLPQGWLQLVDPEGRRFYQNYLTGECQYQPPGNLPDPAQYLTANGTGSGHLPNNLFQ